MECAQKAHIEATRAHISAQLDHDVAERTLSDYTMSLTYTTHLQRVRMYAENAHQAHMQVHSTLKTYNDAVRKMLEAEGT
jgi:hypothetical protein